MQIEKCKDLGLLIKMKQSVDAHMVRLLEEKDVDAYSELSLEKLKVDLRIDELQKNIEKAG